LNDEKDIQSRKGQKIEINRMMAPVFQTNSRTQTSTIIAGIKPLPPGLIPDIKTSQKNKFESKPAIDMYNLAKMPMAPPIKSKDKKDGKERGFKENIEPKDRLIPLQMATSFSGQTLMYKKPDVQAKPPGQKIEVSVAKPAEPAMSSMGLLKYISVSVKCRRVIYEKEYMYELIKEVEQNFSAGHDISHKVIETIKILSEEITKLKEKDFPSGVDEKFIEARKILLQSIEMFIDGLQDLKISLEEGDTDMMDDGRDNIYNAFLKMEKYFTIRDEIKSKMI